jgi:hypothetical protein
MVWPGGHQCALTFLPPGRNGRRPSPAWRVPRQSHLQSH